MTDKPDRWTIRGIAPDLQRRVRERAEAKRYTIGEVVTAALESWLEAPQGIARSQNTLALEDLAERLSEIQVRLDAIEQSKDRASQADPRNSSLRGTSAPRPPSPRTTPSIPRDDPRWTAIKEEALALRRDGLSEVAVAKRMTDAGKPISSAAVGKWWRAAKAAG